MKYPWLCLWNEIVAKDKTVSLTPTLFRAWVFALCTAHRHLGDGTMPPIREFAFNLRVSIATAQRLIDELVARNFIEKDGSVYTIHDWDHYQAPASKNAQKQKRYREECALRNALVTPVTRVTECSPLEGEGEGELEREKEREGEGPPTPIDPEQAKPPPRSGMSSVVTVSPDQLQTDYVRVGELAIQLAGEFSWGTWVTQQGTIGHPARSIELALHKAAGAGKLSKSYVAAILQGWAFDGGPPASMLAKSRSQRPDDEPKYDDYTYIGDYPEMTPAEYLAMQKAKDKTEAGAQFRA